MKRVLIVEDEEGLLEGLAHNFKYEGYEVLTAKNGQEGLRTALKQKPDLVMLDIMLPEKDGFTVLKELRQRHRDIPVLVMTARNFEADVIKGFDLGADDYVTKPFGIKELMARAKRLVARGPSGAPAPGPTIYKFGDVEVRFEPREVHKAGAQVALSFKEFELLKYLIEHRGRTVSREELLEEIWGVDEELGVTTRTVDTHVSNLRSQAGGRLRAAVHRGRAQGGLQVRGAVIRAVAAAPRPARRRAGRGPARRARRAGAARRRLRPARERPAARAPASAGTSPRAVLVNESRSALGDVVMVGGRGPLAPALDGLAPGDSAGFTLEVRGEDAVVRELRRRGPGVRLGGQRPRRAAAAARCASSWTRRSRPGWPAGRSDADAARAARPRRHRGCARNQATVSRMASRCGVTGAPKARSYFEWSTT